MSKVQTKMTTNTREREGKAKRRQGKQILGKTRQGREEKNKIRVRVERKRQAKVKNRNKNKSKGKGARYTRTREIQHKV